MMTRQHHNITDMNSEELELFPFVTTSGRNSDNCKIILIEIYKEGRKMTT